MIKTDIYKFLQIIRQLIQLENEQFIYTFQVNFNQDSTVVPLGLLSYVTVVKLSKKQKIGYGQWIVMIITIALSNLLSLFIKLKGWMLLFDLAVKLSVALLPSNINKSIQKMVKQLRLQKQIQYIRKAFLHKFFIFHLKISEYMFTKMDDSQMKKFRSIIVERFCIEPNSQLKTKCYENVGVECDFKIEKQNLEATNPIIKSFIEKKEREEKLKKKKLNDNFSSIKQLQQLKKRDAKTLPVSNSAHHLHNTKPEKSKQSYQPLSFNKNKGIEQPFIKRSSTNILDQIDFEDQKPNKFSQNIQLMSFNGQQKTNQSPQQAYNFKKSRSKVQEINNVAERLLNELDVTVSEYSSMFQEEEMNQSRALICKIEAIVETGNGASVRLQIYNLELYSNDDFRIVSLYDRQFQKHKLISMKPLPNNYYELKLSGTPVTQRKVKFRSNAQPFMKYLQ